MGISDAQVMILVLALSADQFPLMAHRRQVVAELVSSRLRCAYAGGDATFLDSKPQAEVVC